MDFYRIEQQNELSQLGWEEMIYTDAVTFIEWPERIEQYLDHFYKISIVMKDKIRHIELLKK
jgi:tRNA A37 threonylcarbamoyladenosine biosynthesis protein TsaE